MTLKNVSWVFLQRPGPEGMSEALFEQKECPVPEVADGQVLVANYLFSLDPTLRNALSGPEKVSQCAQGDRAFYYQFMNWVPGQVPAWFSLGFVLESKKEGVKVGDVVKVMAPWQKFVAVSEAEVVQVDDQITAENHISALGITGMTAMLPFRKYIHPKAGETAFVSGGAGATGMVICQLLKAAGCHVIASAGSDEKVEFLKTLGVEAFNYKSKPYLETLQKLCPKGINIYWDNIGGQALEAALEVMNEYGRVIACGAICGYDVPPEQRSGVKNLFHIIGKRLMVQGFICLPGEQFSVSDFAEAKEELTKLLRSGQLVDHFTLMEGFDALPKALCGLFKGHNTGKMLVNVPEAKQLAKEARLR